MVEYLIAQGAEKDRENLLEGNTPLIAAISEGKLKSVRSLLGCGVDVNKSDSTNTTTPRTCYCCEQPAAYHCSRAYSCGCNC